MSEDMRCWNCWDPTLGRCIGCRQCGETGKRTDKDKEKCPDCNWVKHPLSAYSHAFDCPRFTAACGDEKDEDRTNMKPPGCICPFTDGKHKLSCARQLSGQYAFPATRNEDGTFSVQKLDVASEAVKTAPSWEDVMLGDYLKRVDALARGDSSTYGHALAESDRLILRALHDAVMTRLMPETRTDNAIPDDEPEHQGCPDCPACEATIDRIIGHRTSEAPDCPMCAGQRYYAICPTCGPRSAEAKAHPIEIDDASDEARYDRDAETFAETCGFAKDGSVATNLKTMLRRHREEEAARWSKIVTAQRKSAYERGREYEREHSQKRTHER